MKQSDFKDLPELSIYRYENFFNIYEDASNNKFYNLLRSINVFPAQNSSIEDEYTVQINDTWVLISYKYYGTMYLWWLVCEYNRVSGFFSEISFNKTLNPTINPEPGTKLKLLKKDYVSVVISSLNKQINR